MGKKGTFRSKRGTFSDKMLRKSALFLNKEGARITFKMTLLLRKRAPFDFWEQAPLPPPPPIPPPLTVALQGQ